MYVVFSHVLNKVYILKQNLFSSLFSRNKSIEINGLNICCNCKRKEKKLLIIVSINIFLKNVYILNISEIYDLEMHPKLHN